MKHIRFSVIAITSLLALSAFSPLTEPPEHAAHWGYEGEGGPEHWGDLDPAFGTCSTGQMQSPINIESFAKISHQRLDFHYQPSSLKVVHNGHTIQANYDAGSFISMNGERYELLQLHFHSPSENTKEGKHATMEMHLVHKSDAGLLAVVGVMMNEGEHNDALNSLWDAMPMHKSEEASIEATINAMDLLPTTGAHYTFMGSLTTPPCSEGVHWNVMAEPINIGMSQAQKFLSAVGENARPVQPLNGRTLAITQN